MIILERITLDPYTGITPRELEIFSLIAQGYTDKEIAKRLYLSHNTVSTHRKNALRNLDAKSSTQVVTWLIQENLLKLTKNINDENFT